MAESPKQLVQENERLKAHIKKLEVQLNDRQAPRLLDQAASERAKDLPLQVADEASRTMRAFVIAGVEATRRHAEILAGFAEEVLGKNRPSAEAPHARDLVMKLPGEIASAAVNAIDASLKSQQEIVDKFAEVFRETPVPQRPVAPAPVPQTPVRQRRGSRRRRSQRPVSQKPSKA
jgi:hypothetical protein